MRANSRWHVPTTIAGLLLTCGVVTAVRAQTEPDARSYIERRFDQLDKNRDGRVTPDELPTPELFKRFDLNGDGVITRAEAVEAMQRNRVLDQLRNRNAAADKPPESSNPPASATDDLVKPSAETGSAPVSSLPAPPPIRQAPQVVRPGDHGIGRQVPDLSFTDLQGRVHRLSELARQQPVVLVQTSTSCPLSQKYLPTLAELAQATAADTQWVLINAVATDALEEMLAAASRVGESVIYVPDATGELSHALGALTTTDAIVIDAARTVVYHGAVDDQYGFGYALDAPRRQYLADALSAISAGEIPDVSATLAPGCVLARPRKSAEEAANLPGVTYHNRISRIMQRHCVECHRAGGVAPFTLDSYADLVAHRGMIREVLERGIMPPWFAADPAADADTGRIHSPWSNDRSLGKVEKADLLAWLTADTPEGNPADAPRPRVFDDEWLIGKPDAVYQFTEPVPIKATGVMAYQNIKVPTHLEEDEWVQAIEIQPGNRSVVHHVLVFVQTAADADKPRDDQADEASGYWGIYVPGNSTLVYPEGFAKRLPRGATLRFQMHYTPNGTATTDQTRIGLIFAKEPPRHEVRVAGVVNARLSIPPGADNHREVATLRLPSNVQVLAFLPHMHLRGKACLFEVTTADGQTRTLLDIPRYDFNWQLLYRYREPLPLQAGDTIRFTAWYDNSAGNPANPDPTKTVRWGAQTYDEMHLGYIEYYIPGVTPGERSGAARLRGGAALPQRRVDIEAAFKRLDRNGDGQLTQDEIPPALREALKRLDSDGDGIITLEEARRAGR